MFKIRGLVAVLLVGGLVSIPIYRYWKFLTRGQQPSTSTLRLNQLERDGVPEITLPGLDGKDISLSQFEGKAVLVNLWASWCAPCVKEIPSLKGLVEHFKGELVVLAVSQDHSREDLDSFVKAFGGVPKDFVIVWDRDKKVGEMLGTEQLPETYILNRKHKLVRKVAGEQVWNEPMALEFFKEALDL